MFLMYCDVSSLVKSRSQSSRSSRVGSSVALKDDEDFHVPDPEWAAAGGRTGANQPAIYIQMRSIHEEIGFLFHSTE